VCPELHDAGELELCEDPRIQGEDNELLFVCCLFVCCLFCFVCCLLFVLFKTQFATIRFVVDFARTSKGHRVQGLLFWYCFCMFSFFVALNISVVWIVVCCAWSNKRERILLQHTTKVRFDGEQPQITTRNNNKQTTTTNNNKQQQETTTSNNNNNKQQTKQEDNSNHIQQCNV
jgi:hypothetical protein